jgi:hypothetical protein
MENSFFDIQKIRLVIGTFDIRILKPGKSYITEISDEGIIEYETNPGSKKQLNKIVIRDIPKDEIEKFFDEIFEFSRKNLKTAITVDDCSYTVTFTYSSFHKEVFEGWCGDDETTIVRMAEGFVNNWKNKNQI